MLNKVNTPQQPKEPKTPQEFVEQNLIFLRNMNNQALEQVRNVESIIKDLKEDFESVKTPELKPVIQNLLGKYTQAKKQGLEMIKRSRKDMVFFNEIYKKLKEVRK